MPETEQGPEFVTDEQIDRIGSEADAHLLFARSEASGAGDFEVTDHAKSASATGFVGAYDVAAPDWSPGYLRSVEKAMRPMTAADVTNLSADLGPSRRATAGNIASHPMETDEGSKRRSRLFRR